MTTKATVLVTAGNGKTGRRIVERLQAQNIPVRIGSRSTEPAFDWDNESTWEQALQDIDSVYIAYPADLAVAGSVGVIQQFVDKAVASGVRRLVLLSGRGEPEAQACEKVVEKSGLEWTVVRASFFAQNFSEGFIVEGIQQGEVVLPIVNVTEPFIDAEDIADVATAALTEDRHSGKVYEVTGPRLLSFESAIEEIATASGRQIQFTQIPMQAYIQAARDMGVSEEALWLIEYLFTTVLDGRNEHLCDGVQQALGREPRDFSAYVQELAATGLWRSSDLASTTS